eukprot:TRINITY_DN8502_c0_g1_i3.p1 TRINITY_DN8502_c0_g1~~TRINITY_DN8502_c0_g1_i3.p1  ORF type:complete len:427 (+),score=41.30 TRINITY_DN8502_c0_g1_i3:3-1283(+)
MMEPHDLSLAQPIYYGYSTDSGVPLDDLLDDFLANTQVRETVSSPYSDTELDDTVHSVFIDVSDCESPSEACPLVRLKRKAMPQGPMGSRRSQRTKRPARARDTVEIDMLSEVPATALVSATSSRPKKMSKSEAPIVMSFSSSLPSKKVVAKQWFAQRKAFAASDNVCSACSEGGELVVCDGLGCSAVYHPRCAGHSTVPQVHKWLCPPCMRSRARARCHATKCSGGEWLMICSKCYHMEHAECCELRRGATTAARELTWYCKTCLPEAWENGSYNGSISPELILHYLESPFPWNFQRDSNTKILDIGMPVKKGQVVHHIGFKSHYRCAQVWYENSIDDNAMYHVKSLSSMKVHSGRSPSNAWQSAIKAATGRGFVAVSGPVNFRFSEHKADPVSALVHAILQANEISTFSATVAGVEEEEEEESI